MRKFIRDETVALCYIDPPFNSKRNYNQIYNNIGTEDRTQGPGFMDTWTWDDHANQCYEEILTNKNGVQVAVTRESHKLDAIVGAKEYHRESERSIYALFS